MKKSIFRLFFLVAILTLNYSCHRDLDAVDDVAAPIITPISTLSVTSARDGVVYLYWLPITQYAVKYQIYIGSANTNVFTKIAETTTNSFTVRDLNYDSTYKFTVTVFYNNVESEFSNIVTARPYNYTQPAAPANVMVQGLNYEGKLSMYVSWSKNSESDLHHYNIFRLNSDAGSTAIKVKETTDNFYNDTSNLRLNYQISYAVAAVDRGGMGSFLSAYDSDIILDTALILEPVNNSTVHDRIVFKWKPVPKAIGYKIFLLSTPLGTEIWQKTIQPSTSGNIEVVYDGEQLIYRRNYYWKVCAFTKSSSLLNSYTAVKSFYFTYSE